MPRGYVHYAKTPPDTSSCHVTVSTYQQHTYMDFLINLTPLALRFAFDKDIEFRKGIPRDYFRSVGSAAAAASFSQGEDYDDLGTSGKSFVSKVRDLFLKTARYITPETIAHICDATGNEFMEHRLPPKSNKTQQHKSGTTPFQPGAEFRMINPKMLQLTIDHDSAQLHHCLANSRDLHMGPPIEEEGYSDGDNEDDGEEQQRKEEAREAREAGEAGQAKNNEDEHEDEHVENDENEENDPKRAKSLMFPRSRAIVLSILMGTYPRYMSFGELEKRVSAAVGEEGYEAASPGALNALLGGLHLEGLLESRAKGGKRLVQAD
mmetsp:Transcript_18792/g.33629  ORF Transcript_18792/g.33629 Transcript_18792/m.33629 type:complete len:321 (+) Transcript_18792:982-1944(+)